MVQELQTLVGMLKKSPLPAICALLVAAVTYLVMHIAKMSVKQEILERSYRTELVATEQRCAKEKDDLRRDHIRLLEAALEAQKKINEQIQKKEKRR